MQDPRPGKPWAGLYTYSTIYPSGSSRKEVLFRLTAT